MTGHDQEETVTGEGVHVEGEQHFSGTYILLLVPGKKHNAGHQKGTIEARKREWTAGQDQDHSRGLTPLTHFHKGLKEQTVHDNKLA